MATKKKTKTLDDFAAAIHEDYVRLDERIEAVRGNLEERIVNVEQNLTNVIHETEGLKMNIREIREDLQQIKYHMVSKANLRAIIRNEYRQAGHTQRINKLEIRVDRIEDNLGLE